MSSQSFGMILSLNFRAVGEVAETKDPDGNTTTYTPRGNEPPGGSPKWFVMDAVKPGYNRQARVVGAEVITARHRSIALLVAGCYFMEMLDGTNMMIS